MADLLFLALGVGFFALSWGLVRFFLSLEKGTK